MKNQRSIKSISVLFIVSLLLFLPLSSAHAATTYTSVMSGLWNDPATWGGGGYPVSANGDSAVISAGDTVTLAADTAVSGNLTINSSGTLATGGYQLTIALNFINNGSLNAGSSNIVIGGSIVDQSIAGFTTTGTVSMTKAGGTATLTGNVSAAGLTLNGSGGTLDLGSGLTHTISTTWTRTAGTLDGGSSTLILTGGVSGTGDTFDADAGTVNYAADGPQTLAAVTYNDLILSGSGAKTTTGATVNGVLSMEGTATVSGTAPTYGTTATLKYNTSTARNTGSEWRTPFTSTGGVIIANTGAISLNATKVLDPGIPLLINSGATLASNASLSLTVGGDLTNNGTFTVTAGTLNLYLQGNFTNTGVFSIANSRIYLTGGATQSIAGFTTTGNFYMNKTGGTATFMGDVSAASLYINGSGGTLNLGSGRSHAFSGTWYMTAGTLEAGSSTMSLVGSSSGASATFSAGTSTVIYSGAAQAVGGFTYYNLTTTGSGAKTTSGAVTVNGALTVGAGTNFTVAGYDITVVGATTVNGTLTHNSAAGVKTYTGLVTITDKWINTGNADIHFRGGLTYNGTTFTSGSGAYIFETHSQGIGGSGAISVATLTVTGVTLTNSGTLTVNTDMNGTGTVVQGPGATLNIAGTSSISTLTATASGNTVNYNDTADQTIPGMTFYHLGTGGTGIKTIAGNITINGNLIVGGSTNLTVTGFNITVIGTTTVDGTLTHSSATGTKTYTGLVTINTGAAWINTGNANIHLRGGLTHNGATFTAGSGTYFFETNDQTIDGASVISISTVSVPVVDLTNSGTLTVTTDLGGSGTLVQDVDATLNIAGTSSISALTATANPNAVNYSGAGQTVIATLYHHLTLSGSGVKNLAGVTTVNGNLTLSGTASATTVATLTIGGALTIGNGTSFTVGGYDITVSGATTLNGTGTLTHTSATGAKTYTGNVTINTGSTWYDNADVIAISFGGDLQNNGTMYAGTGVHTFTGSGKAFSGTITIPNINITGSYTNNGTLTAGTSLAGAGTLAQGTPNPTLNLGGNLTITTLTATSNPNTVKYVMTGAQTIRAIPYHHLMTGGTSTKTFAGPVTISGDLTIGTGTTLDVSASNYAINLVGNWVNNGTFEPQLGTVTLQSSAAQSMTGTTTFHNLTVNNSLGISLSSNVTINASLTLTSGKITTGTRTVILGTSASIVGASTTRYINGNLQKTYLTGSQSFVYDIGDAVTYTPLTLNFANITATGGVTAKSTLGEHPNVNTSGLDSSLDVNRYWTLTSAGTLAFTSYDATFTYAAGNKDPGADANIFIVKRNISTSTWAATTIGTRTATSTQATGITGMGGFAIGQPDVTPPAVTNVSSTKADGAYKAGVLIPIRVTFTEMVKVTGVPQLALKMEGAANRVLNYSSGTGTNTLTFNYNIQAGDTSSDLDYVDAGSLTLNGGTVLDYNDNSAVLTLPIPGAEGSLSANKDLVIDTTAPETAINSQPANPDANPTPTFAFSGNDGTGSGVASLMCKIDEIASYAACSSPFLAAALYDGPHTFFVYAVDLAGNVDATPASYTWTVDATAPETAITGKPTNPNNDITPAFSFTGNDGTGTGIASYMCKMDAGSYAACTSGLSWTALTDGPHTFYVYAIDNAGNADASPAFYTWTVDATRPTTTMTGQPPNPDKDNTPTFTFTGADGTGTGVASYMCKMDGNSYAPCISPYPSSTLADGSHTFSVYAVDFAGNADATPASYTWTLDATGPDTTITGHPPAVDNDTTPTFTFTGNDGAGTGVASFMCKMDGGSYAACTSGLTWTALADGSHTFYVYAIDNLGNAEATPATYTWTIQTTRRIFLPLVIRP